MADIFVDSAAGGANNGTDWTNAYTSIASTVGAAAGDVIKVDDGHAEDPGGATTWNWSNGTIINPVRIICVDKTNSDALSTGALIGTTGAFAMNIQGHLYVRGITWRSGSTMTLSGNTANVQKHENCTVNMLGTGVFAMGSSRSSLYLVNTNIDFTNATGAGVYVNLNNGGGLFHWLGGTETLRGTQTNAFNTTGAGNAIITGVTISGTCTNIVTFGNVSLDARFVACNLPSHTTKISATPDHDTGRVIFDRCAAGTITDPPLGFVNSFGRAGTVTETLAKYRTGGASDGEQANAVSWELTTGTNAAEFTTPIATDWMYRWVAAGASQDVTIYVAGAASMSDDDFWIEVLSPSEEVSATAASKYNTTRMAALGTPAALTSDGVSTWNGSDVGTKQKCTVTISPTIPGVVQVRACLAKPSTTVNVDPLVEVS